MLRIRTDYGIRSEASLNSFTAYHHPPGTLCCALLVARGGGPTARGASPTRHSCRAMTSRAARAGWAPRRGCCGRGRGHGRGHGRGRARLCGRGAGSWPAGRRAPAEQRAGGSALAAPVLVLARPGLLLLPCRAPARLRAAVENASCSGRGVGRLASPGVRACLATLQGVEASPEAPAGPTRTGPGGQASTSSRAGHPRRARLARARGAVRAGRVACVEPRVSARRGPALLARARPAD